MHILSAARRVLFVGVVTAVAAVGAAGAAQAAVVHGTVVHRNARAGSFVVADRAGHLYAIHAARSPRVGSTVAVSTRRLHNGTYAARWTRTLGYHRNARVRLHGIVSYVDRRHGTFTLSAPGVSMLVRTRSGHSARIADAPPPVGTIVTATGNVDDQGELNDDTVQTDGQDNGGFDLEGTILAVDTTGRKITVSSTDDDQTANSIVVSVPSTLDISMFSVGEEVELTVTQQPDGTFILTGSASDQGQQGADDQGEQQGDQGDDGGDLASTSSGSDSSGTGPSTVDD
jgi:hypothetical protein